MPTRFLIVDDEQDFLESLERGLLVSGFRNIRAESDPRKAAVLFQQGEPVDIALIDMTMPGMTGIELLDIIKTCSPTTECIMVTAADEARLAVSCMKKELLTTGSSLLTWKSCYWWFSKRWKEKISSKFKEWESKKGSRIWVIPALLHPSSPARKKCSGS